MSLSLGERTYQILEDKGKKETLMILVFRIASGAFLMNENTPV